MRTKAHFSRFHRYCFPCCDQDGEDIDHANHKCTCGNCYGPVSDDERKKGVISVTVMTGKKPDLKPDDDCKCSGY